MRSASIAEWMIGRLTSKKRATSVVGDLIELRPQKGLVWFWVSLVRVMLSLCWRRALGFVVAFYALNWMLAAFQTAFMGAHTQHRPLEYPWIPVFTVLAPAGAFSWMVLMYAAIRYGFQDRVTQFALASTALVTAVIFYWWQPVILSVCIALSICLMLVSILKREHRKAALVLLATVTIGLGSGVLGIYLVARYQHFVYSGAWGDKEMHAHPSVPWMAFCMYLMVAWTTMTVCARMHDWSVRNKLGDEEAEEELA